MVFSKIWSEVEALNKIRKWLKERKRNYTILIVVILCLAAGVPFIKKGTEGMSWEGLREFLSPSTLSPSPGDQGIEPKLEIRNGGFEKGICGLESWEHWESGNRVMYANTATPDTVVPSAPNMTRKPGLIGDVISVRPEVGNNLTNGLVLECPVKPSSNKYSCLKQKLYGLKEGGRYKIRFWIHQYENAQINPDSVYMAIGIPWQIEEGEEGKIFSSGKLKNGWNEITLVNRDREADYFFIVVNYITNGLVLDDISIEEEAGGR